MRALPRRYDASGRVAAPPRGTPSIRLCSTRDETTPGNGAGDARCIHLRLGAYCFERSTLRRRALESIFMSQPTEAPSPLIPVPRGPVPQAPSGPSRRHFDIQIDDKIVSVPENATILEAARLLGIDTPTLCYLENLTPVNVCRVCVVELEGSRVLVPACSRKVEPGMVIRTDSERVRLSRRLVLEFLASSGDVSTAPDLQKYMQRYGADAGRYGSGSTNASQPPKLDNELYVRDYAKCILCYKCVEACGLDAQNTF